MSFCCTDKDTLIAFLYGECDDATSAAVNAHVADCPACADEVRGFARVRETLSQWAPPDRVGGFRLVRDEPAVPARAATVLRPARWWQGPLPVLGRVAAAILLFAGGAAMANLDIHYDQNGLSVRTGWQQAARSPSPAATGAVSMADYELPSAPETSAMAPTTVSTPTAGTPWRLEMAALERNLREEFHRQLAAARASSSGIAPTRVSFETDTGEARLMAQVHALIDESDRRQQLEMSYRINQLEHDMQARRTADVIRGRQSFGQLGATPVYLPEQRQMMNYIRLNPVTLKK